MGTRVENDPRQSSPHRSGDRSNDSSSTRGRERSASRPENSRSSRGKSTGHHRRKDIEKSSSKQGKSSSSRRRSVPATSHRRSASRSHKNDASLRSLDNSAISLSSNSPRRKSSRRESNGDSKQRHQKLRSHDLLNKERALHNLPPLSRTSFLDKIAQSHAATLARELVVFHSVTSAAELHIKLQAQTSVAENVQSGLSMEEMHEAIMAQVGSSSYNNILGHFDEVGIGKARGKDGRLYMCQVFRTK